MASLNFFTIFSSPVYVYLNENISIIKYISLLSVVSSRFIPDLDTH